MGFHFELSLNVAKAHAYCLCCFGAHVTNVGLGSSDDSYMDLEIASFFIIFFIIFDDCSDLHVQLGLST